MQPKLSRASYHARDATTTSTTTAGMDSFLYMTWPGMDYGVQYTVLVQNCIFEASRLQS